MRSATGIRIQENVPLPTWFKIGGGADRFAAPASVEELRGCLELDSELVVLGDGANLLVDDDGVGELVVSLKEGLGRVDWDPRTGRVIAQAGAALPKLVVEAVRQGLGGVEGLGGIPATVGGAVIMNAGGAYGQIADVVARVHAITRDGREVVRERDEIDFSYRHSGLTDVIVTAVELSLTPGDPAPLRAKLKDVMAYKKSSQPMADNSAGCCFKNPTLTQDLRDSQGEIGPAGKRVSAGMLIDRAGLKGLHVGAAEVSPRHGNFIVTRPGARARDVILLMQEVERRIMDRFGVRLEREVVVWSRSR